MRPYCPQENGTRPLHRQHPLRFCTNGRVTLTITGVYRPCPSCGDDREPTTYGIFCEQDDTMDSIRIGRLALMDGAWYWWKHGSWRRL